MVKAPPDPNEAPPVGLAYQLIVAPVDAVAFNVTVPTSQRAPSVVEFIVGEAFTVALTSVLLTVVHPLSVAST
ncbi:hypothetical protein GIY83_16630 [Flavobacterium sp. SLB02]|nr:hypothetical protein GIY83_16630 [Flavobacterium sp. SLB02]